MVNTILSTALGALVLFSPQPEPAYYDNISVRETDLTSIAVQAESGSTHLTYRSPIDYVSVAQVKQKEAIAKKLVQKVEENSTKTYPAVSHEELINMIDKYATIYGAKKELMIPIMRCESGFNTNAINGPFAGLFQFISSTWISNRKAMGLDPNPSLRFNAEEAIKTAAFKMGRDGYGAWPACSEKAFKSPS